MTILILGNIGIVNAYGILKRKSKILLSLFVIYYGDFTVVYIKKQFLELNNWSSKNIVFTKVPEVSQTTFKASLIFKIIVLNL
jgi:hypothetical protein